MKLALKKLLQAHPSIQVSTLLSGTLTTPSARTAFVPPTSFQSISSVSPSGTGVVTFSSIPQNFEILQVRASIITSSSFSISTTYNGDTTASYSHSSSDAQNSSRVAVQNHAGNNLAWFNYYGTSSSATFPASLIIDLPNYATSGTYKTAIGYYAANENTTSSIGFGQGVWFNTAPITSWSFSIGANYGSGTVFSLYGIEG